MGAFWSLEKQRKEKEDHRDSGFESLVLLFFVNEPCFCWIFTKLSKICMFFVLTFLSVCRFCKN